MVGAVTNEGFFNIVNANTAGITSITSDGTFGPATTTFFFGTNTAGTATIVNRFGGNTTFLDTSSASSANITNRFGGTVFGAMGGTDMKHGWEWDHHQQRRWNHILDQCGGSPTSPTTMAAGPNSSILHPPLAPRPIMN